MKKIISLFIMIMLCGCHHPSQVQPKLYVFYNQTCGSCQLLVSDFLPQVPQEVEVILLDIDDKENLAFYNEVLDRFEYIDESLYVQPITPFIYFEGGFCAIGYDKVMDDVYLQLINESLHNQTYTIIPSGVWVEKGG